MDFKDLEIYRLAEELTVSLYKLTQKFPKEERFGLVDQIRRAVVSICANLAEGYGRYHYKDRLQFYYNARGSLFEVRSLISLSYKLGFIGKNELEVVESKLKNLQVKLHNFIEVNRKRFDKQ